MSRVDWQPVVARAALIVSEYSTGVTLRQLFYRLVAEGTLPNTTGAYKSLSSKTAEARRRGEFPSLIDRGRAIHNRGRTFESADDARRWLERVYRRDRTEGQDWSVYLGVEKAGMVEQLTRWFGDLGLPILALGGYSSESYVTDVVDDVESQDRAAVLLYAGDFDPSGEDIDRDFEERTDCWWEVVRVALSADQVAHYNLPPQPGKTTDSRADAFTARHGELVQVELDALDPNDLRTLFTDALDEFWDTSAFETVTAREDQERHELGSSTP